MSRRLEGPREHRKSETTPGDLNACACLLAVFGDISVVERFQIRAARRRGAWLAVSELLVHRMVGTNYISALRCHWPRGPPVAPDTIGLCNDYLPIPTGDMS